VLLPDTLPDSCLSGAKLVELESLKSDPANWRAADLRGDHSGSFDLTPAQQREIEAAVAASAAAGQPIHDISRDSFKLPGLGPLLARLRDRLIDGRGFALLRGLAVERLDREQVMRAYFGIGSHIGTPRPQNRAGHLIGHVTDLGEDPSDPRTRIYRTSGRQRFHVDSCDVVGLLCLQRAKSGGASALCSSLAIVQAIAERRPDLAAVLAQPFIYDRKGEIPAGKHAHYPMPIWHRCGDKHSVYFARDFIDSAQARFADIPRLSEAQCEALDLLEQLAQSPEFHIRIDFRPGDIQLLHNHVLLHSREAYEDFPEPARRRHLLRLWLSPQRPRPLPAAFEERYGPIRGGLPRGGICVPGVAPVVAMQPQ